MHLQSCLHPVRIYNKYIKTFQYVPCGKCSACRNRHASYWTDRLRTECSAWRYVAFCTLTYEIDKRPCFYTKDCVTYVGEPKSFNPDLEVPIIDFNEMCLSHHLSSADVSRNVAWLTEVAKFGRVPHLSRYHVQLFVKRLRKNLNSIITRNYANPDSSDYFVRYFIAGEYGETTYHPHYHCLFFFNSEKEAKFFKEAIYGSWKYGNVNVSFVRNDASAYVASYVNSYSHLPLLLQHRSVRPFALFSKSVPIGTLAYNDADIKDMFSAASPSFVRENYDHSGYVNVPLWRTFKDRLFPRIPLFSQFSHRDRIVLYSSVSRLEAFSGKEVVVNSFVGYTMYCFKQGVVNRFYNSTYSSYINALVEHLGYDEIMLQNNLIHLFYISNRVWLQSVLYGISIEDYVSKIESFYVNVEVENLKSYFKFQEQFSLDYGSDSLLSLDLDYLQTLFNIDRCDLSAEDILRLSSYGVDLDRFYSDDLSVSLPYRMRFVPESSIEFISYLTDSEVIANNRTKTKRKNDYLNKLAASDSVYKDLLLALSSF